VADTKRNFRTADILSDDIVTRLREQLLEKRRRILDLYAADVKAGQESHQEDTDDYVDRANSSYNRELMFSLSSAEREQLIEVDEALRRIDQGTFGYCMYSGKPIGLPRLEAIPWARYSVEYQELAEKGLLDEDSAVIQG
jgi:DnaK suppressor protein